MFKHRLPITPEEKQLLLHAVELRRNNWAAHEPYLDSIYQALRHGELLPPEQWTGLAVIGSTIVCIPQDDPDGVRTWKLVMPADEDEEASRVSVLSPVGWKLLGMRAGEAFEFNAATGEVGTFYIEHVSPPETQGAEVATFDHHPN